MSPIAPLRVTPEIFVDVIRSVLPEDARLVRVENEAGAYVLWLESASFVEGDPIVLGFGSDEQEGTQ